MLFPDDQIWMIVVGFLVAFILAFGIGANDVANSFGTSVGARALTLKQACILATICELAGSTLLGSKVSSTIRKGIVKTELFVSLTNGTSVLMIGQVAALGGSCIWLLVATFFRLPVSGTHSIVGATIGFSLVVFGIQSIQWWGVLRIVASWFLSPVLSGLSSVAMFYLLKFVVLRKQNQLEPALKLLPAFYGTVVLVNIFSIFYDGPSMLKFNEIPLYGVFIISCGCAVITVFCVHFLVVPWLRCRFLSHEAKLAAQLDQNVPVQSIHFKIAPRHRTEITTIDEVTSKTSENGLELAVLEKSSKTTTTTTTSASKEDRSSAKPQPKSKKPFPSLRQLRSVQKKQTKRADEADESQSPQLSSPGQASHNSDQMNSKITNQSGTEFVVELVEPDTPQDSDPTKSHPKSPVEGEVFTFLQIITAVFGSFAHGGNDVSNAIGPLIALWITGITQSVTSEEATPIWILVYGGFGIAVGLWIWGRRVIQTIGEDLTQITPSTGVCIEIGSAVTVLVASKIGLPISTTHCKVGSVVGVGRARSKESVNWRVFRNILIAWLVTLPVSGAISALLMYLLMFIV